MTLLTLKNLIGLAILSPGLKGWTNTGKIPLNLKSGAKENKYQELDTPNATMKSRGEENTLNDNGKDTQQTERQTI